MVLSLSEKTVYRRIADGTLRVIRLGRTIRIPLKSLAKLRSF